jgi:hypothetical protein
MIGFVNLYSPLYTLYKTKEQCQSDRYKSNPGVEPAVSLSTIAQDLQQCPGMRSRLFDSILHCAQPLTPEREVLKSSGSMIGLHAAHVIEAKVHYGNRIRLQFILKPTPCFSICAEKQDSECV